MSTLPAPRPVTVTASDGRALGGLLLEAVAPRGALCINGATGFKREFYLKFAAYCALRGYHALVYDYDTKSNRTGITSLLSDLRAAGIRFFDIDTTQSSLEHIFVSLVHAP